MHEGTSGGGDVVGLLYIFRAAVLKNRRIKNKISRKKEKGARISEKCRAAFCHTRKKPGKGESFFFFPKK